MHTFITNGAWCWFQDERAVIDSAQHRLIVGSTNMQASCDVAFFDLERMTLESSKRFSSLGTGKQDDHNAPAVMVAPNGNYLCMWAHHYDSKHHYSIYKKGQWSAEKTIEWRTWAPDPNKYDVAYSNLYYLSDEKRIYNFARTFNVRSQHFVYSDDKGESWKFGGQLTTHNVVDTYNRGYYKYWGNGKDRVDMAFTEEHPRDQTTSIYHGYIMDHKLYDSYDNVADEDMYDATVIPTFTSFTKVFGHNTVVNGDTMGRCWQHDICRYDNGIIVILFKARANNAIDDHRNFYARFDGTTWNMTYIGKAGKHIYGNEHDYTGTGTINPDDPNRIYISSTHNPGDDAAAPASKREIWRGTSKDEGKTWNWEAITARSTKDNFRPIVPKWKPGKEALLWFRGVYDSAQAFRSEVVGTFYEYEYEPPVAAKPMTKISVQKSDAPFFYSVSGHRVQLHYHVQEASAVTLRVFSISGKYVVTLFSGVQCAGNHRINWNTASIPGGTYLVFLSVGGSSWLERVTVVGVRGAMVNRRRL